MVIITDANGNIQSPTIPENIYQGSNLANEIVFLSPLAQNNQCSIIFRLPNGAVTQEHFMTPYTSVPSEYGLNGWVFQIPADITAYYGQVTFQIKMYGPTNSSGSTQIVASCQGTFPVLRGVAPLPSETPSTDTFAEIMAYLQTLTDGSLVSKATSPYDSTFSYPIGATLFDKDTTTLYTSLQDDNLGHALTDTSWWATTTIGSMEGVEQMINDAISTHNTSATAHQDLFNAKGIKEITSQNIRITDLDTGIYKWAETTGGKHIYYNGESSTDMTDENISTSEVVYLYVSKTSSLYGGFNWCWYYTYAREYLSGLPYQNPYTVYGATTSSSGVYKKFRFGIEDHYISGVLANEIGYTATYINNQINAVIEIAEGKTKTYTISDVTNPAFNSTAESITLAVSGSITDTLGNVIDFADMKVGDIILITDTAVPDRWVGSIDTTNIIFYKMETNIVDLDNYVLKSTTIAGVDLQDNITKSELNTALDTVTLSDVQTITGKKTFSGNIAVNSQIDMGTGSIKYTYNNIGLNLNGNDMYLFASSAFQPNGSTNSGRIDLGGVNRYWKDIYLAGNLSDGTNSISVANIENKNDYTKLTALSGSAAPTTATVANFVGQFYIDTANNNTYQCTTITEDTSTTPSTFSYTWTAVGGGSGKYLHLFNGRMGNSGTDGYIFFGYIDTDSALLSSQVAGQQLGPTICDKIRSLGYTTATRFLGATGRVNTLNYKATIYGIYGYNGLVNVMFSYPSPVTSPITIDGSNLDVVTSINFATTTDYYKLTKNYIYEKVIAL